MCRDTSWNINPAFLNRRRRPLFRWQPCNCVRHALDLLCELLVEAAVADEGLLGVQVLVERFADDRVAVDTDAYLLQHCIDIGVALELAAFAHHDHTPTSLFDVSPDVLQLLSIERQARPAQQEQVSLLELFQRQGRLVDFALYNI